MVCYKTNLNKNWLDDHLEKTQTILLMNGTYSYLSHLKFSNEETWEIF